MADDNEIIDVEAVEVEAERLETPNLPAVPDDGRHEVRFERRRVDALRIGDDVRAPREGMVTGIVMCDDGWIELALVGPDGATIYEVPMDHAVTVVVPEWRPGEFLDQLSGMRAWGRLDPQVAQLLAQAAQ
jgi:hypothetical protein